VFTQPQRINMENSKTKNQKRNQKKKQFLWQVKQDVSQKRYKQQPLKLFHLFYYVKVDAIKY
jgi:hypothetical protein